MKNKFTTILYTLIISTLISCSTNDVIRTCNIDEDNFSYKIENVEFDVLEETIFFTLETQGLRDTKDLTVNISFSYFDGSKWCKYLVFSKGKVQKFESSKTMNSFVSDPTHTFSSGQNMRVVVYYNCGSFCQESVLFVKID